MGPKAAAVAARCVPSVARPRVLGLGGLRV